MITQLPDDPPAIEVRGGPWTDIKKYFDDNVKCGQIQSHDGQGGCGANDWKVSPTFWYPRPGKQYKIRCMKCDRIFGCEVRVDS